MDKILELLFRNPIILFLVGAWLIGMISNVLKAKRAAAERRAASERRGANPLPTSRSSTAIESVTPDPAATQAPLRTSGTQASLGTSGRQASLGTSGTQAPISQRRTFARPSGAQSAGPQVSGSPPQPVSPQRTAEEIAAEMRRVLGLERDPRSEVPPPQIRIEEKPSVPPPPPREPGRRVDPHVGERIRDRQLAKSKIGRARKGGYRMGNLGGRVPDRSMRAAGYGSRYALDDLRKAIVINEILSPPVSMRGFDERRPA